ncbi:MAG: TetR/AcrR family transcriptional regulator [Myxococcota bacterium]
MNANELTESKRRVLQVAERHFMERGYAAVTLLDVAEDLGIKQASLYYHAPGGKQDLFEQVMRYAMLRHAHGIEIALDESDNDARNKLEAVIRWLATQPPLPLTRILGADLRHLEERTIQELSTLANRAIFSPVRSVFERAAERGEIHEHDPDLMARAFFSVLGSASASEPDASTPEMRRKASMELLEVMFEGLSVSK